MGQIDRFENYSYSMGIFCFITKLIDIYIYIYIYIYIGETKCCSIIK